MISKPDFKEIEAVGEYLQEVPYDVTRATLYTASDLYDAYDASDAHASMQRCYDARVYKHYIDTGKFTSCAKEKLARTLHDHYIEVALDRFVAERDVMRIVGVMGGHGALRSDEMYAKVAALSKRLTEMGYTMVSGGGPGAMEATHLGAWMAGRSDADLADALAMLQCAPRFSDPDWLKSAMAVRERYPQHTYQSLGVPTWLYGHEPATPFASHIAKLFQNSIREDGILTIAMGGIVYSPGSAGTVQEIFQDAVQNHYLSLKVSSPMIFLGKQFWSEEMPFYPMLEYLTATSKYRNLDLSLTDEIADVVAHLEDFQRRRQELQP